MINTFSLMKRNLYRNGGNIVKLPATATLLSLQHICNSDIAHQWYSALNECEYTMVERCTAASPLSMWKEHWWQKCLIRI